MISRLALLALLAPRRGGAQCLDTSVANVVFTTSMSSAELVATQEMVDLTTCGGSGDCSGSSCW